MLRAWIVTLLAVTPALAGFNVTGNPANDSFPLKGASLGIGNYVRSSPGSGGVFSFNFYAHEFQLDQVNPLTTMVKPWSPGDKIVMLGGVLTPAVTAASKGWVTGVSNTAPDILTQRINAKFGVNVSPPGPLGNTFSASNAAPPGGNGNGSFTNGVGGFGGGGYGSVQISIGAGNMVTANAGQLLTPSNLTGSNVAQYFGILAGGGPAYGNQGLNLINNTLNAFDVARYMFTVDGAGNLTGWELFLNTTLVQGYVSPFGPSAYGTVPTGGRNWIQTFQNGASAFSDSLAPTDIYTTPAPPAAFVAIAGFGALLLRRRKPC